MNNPNAPNVPDGNPRTKSRMEDTIMGNQGHATRTTEHETALISDKAQSNVVDLSHTKRPALCAEDPATSAGSEHSAGTSDFCAQHVAETNMAMSSTRPYDISPCCRRDARTKFRNATGRHATSLERPRSKSATAVLGSEWQTAARKDTRRSCASSVLRRTPPRLRWL